MITKLSIKNFRGIESAEYDNFGLINSFYGKNGSGKSTVLDCLMWMITGETLTFGNSASVNDKCINENDNNKIIDCEIVINNNVLRRTYGHKFNEEDKTITEVNAFYSNGRRCKTKKDYFEEVNRFLNFNQTTKQKINLLSALINPYTFGKGIDQPIFRRFIMEILNVDFDNILFSNKNYLPIQLDYNSQGKDINNLKDLYNQKVKLLDQQIEESNIKISTAEKVDVNEEEYQKLISEKNNLLSSKFEYNTKVYDLTNELNSKRIELGKSKQEDIENNVSEEEKTLLKEINKLKEQVNEKANKGVAHKNDIIMYNQKIKLLESTIETTKEHIENISKQTFQAIICPECQCVVNKDEEEKYNFNKAEKIKSFNLELEEKEKELNEIKEKKAEVEKQLSELTPKYLEQKQKFFETKQKYEQVKNDQSKNIVSEKTKQLETAILDLENEIIRLREEDNVKSREFIINQNEKLQELNQKIIEMELLKRKVNELDDIKSKKQKHLQEKAKIVSLQDLTKDFELDQVRVTKEYTYKIFGDDVDFVMLKQQKTNDTLKQVCYAQVKGISYDNLNTANALLTGIMVIEKIKAYLGIKDLPIIFDISDNIGNKIMEDILSRTTSQVFYTEVDKTDKSERILKVIK